MAVALFLDNKPVVPDASQSIKLTRENPFFTQADSYTLEVVLPMHIRENRRVLGHLHRIDQAKRPPTYGCRLYADNRLLLVGTATVVHVTQDEVRVQLLGGYSEINFLSANNGDYIDQLPLGTRTPYDKGLAFYSDLSTGLQYSFARVFNETSGEFVDSDVACHPQLVGVMRLVLAHYGYTMPECFLDQQPWNCIYVASAFHTLDVAHKLPHWTVREFITEFCRFFNVTLSADTNERTVLFVSNLSRFSRGVKMVHIDPLEEYTATLSDADDQANLFSSTLAFDVSPSPCHDIDCFSDELRQGLPTLHYDDEAQLRTAWQDMDAAQRRRFVFASTLSRKLSWVYEYDSREVEQLIDVDVMRPLDRGSSQVLRLRIVPVAIGHDDVVVEPSGAITRYAAFPSLDSPTPDETPYPWADDDKTIFTPDVQAVIAGSASLDRGEKEDRMQVFFDDGRWYKMRNEQDVLRLGFTDWRIRYRTLPEPREYWSLALAPPPPAPAEVGIRWLGELHQNPVTFNMKAQLQVQFVIDKTALPSPDDVYLIRGRRYGCEKIEMTVGLNGVEPLATGYFREMYDTEDKPEKKSEDYVNR